MAKDKTGSIRESGSIRDRVMRQVKNKKPSKTAPSPMTVPAPRAKKTFDPPSADTDPNYSNIPSRNYIEADTAQSDPGVKSSRHFFPEEDENATNANVSKREELDEDHSLASEAEGEDSFGTMDVIRVDKSVADHTTKSMEETSESVVKSPKAARSVRSRKLFATSPRGDSTSTRSSRRSVRSIFGGRPFASSKQEHEQQEQRPKPSSHLTREHPNPESIGYSDAPSKVSRGRISKSEHTRSVVSVGPYSEAGTEISCRSLSPEKRKDRLLRKTSTPTSRRTKKSLDDVSVGDTSHVDVFDDESVKDTKKKRLFGLIRNPSASSRKTKTKEPELEAEPKTEFGLVSRDELFNDLKKQGLDKQTYQRWPHAESGGSILGRLITPRRDTPVEIEPLTVGDWSLVSRESECLSNAESHSLDDGTKASNHSTLRKIKKGLFNHFQTSPRARGNDADDSESNADQSRLADRFEDKYVGSASHRGSRVSAGNVLKNLADVSHVGDNIDSLHMSTEGPQTIQSTQASRGSAVSSLRTKTSKSESSGMTSSQSTHGSVVSEDRSESGVETVLAKKMKSRGRQLRLDTNTPTKEVQEVSTSQKPPPKKGIAGLVRRASSTSPRKMYKKVARSSSRSKPKQEPKSGVEKQKKSASVAARSNSASDSARGKASSTETGQRLSSRKKMINFLRRSRSASLAGSVGNKDKKNKASGKHSVQDTFGSGSSSIDPSRDPAQEPDSYLAAESLAKPLKKNKAVVPFEAKIEDKDASTSPESRAGVVETVQQLCSDEDYFPSTASPNQDQDAIEIEVSANSTEGDEPSKQQALDSAGAKNVASPQGGSKGLDMSQNQEYKSQSTVPVEAPRQTVQEEEKLESKEPDNSVTSGPSKEKNANELKTKAACDITATKQKNLEQENTGKGQNEKAPPTEPMHLPKSSFARSVSCRTSKNVSSLTNLDEKLDRTKALADTDSASLSTRISQGTLENSIDTDHATSLHISTLEKSEEDNEDKQRGGERVQGIRKKETLVNKETNYPACGTLGFVFQGDPPGADANKKLVRFSEDLAFVHEIPAAQDSLTIDYKRSSQSLESEKTEESLPPPPAPSRPKKNRLFRWMRRSGRSPENKEKDAPLQCVQENAALEDVGSETSQSAGDSSVGTEDFSASSTKPPDGEGPKDKVAHKAETDNLRVAFSSAHGTDMHQQNNRSAKQTRKPASNKSASNKPASMRKAPPASIRKAPPASIRKAPQKTHQGAVSNKRSHTVRPLPPPPSRNYIEEEGIELIARRTRSGRNAILIAKTGGDPRYDIPAHHRIQERLDLDDAKKPDSDCTEHRSKQKKQRKAPLRLRFFKSGGHNDVRTVTLPRKGPKSRLQVQKTRNERGESPATATTEGESSGTSSIPETKAYSPEERRHAVEMPSLNEFDNVDTVRCPVGLRKQGQTNVTHAYNMASGHVDQAMRDVPVDILSADATGFGPAAESPTRFNESAHFTQGREGEGEGDSNTGGDLFSWLLPSIFKPIPTPQKPQNATRAEPRVYADDLSQETSSVNSKVIIKDEQWQDILNATETLANQYNETQNTEDDGSTRSISEDTIKEVNDAVAKFREHAARLGIQERDLMEAVRDDDRSLPGLKREPKQKKAFVSGMGSAADKFIQMFDFYFTQNAGSSYGGSLTTYK
jgi:hypothetical protein